MKLLKGTPLRHSVTSNSSMRLVVRTGAALRSSAALGEAEAEVTPTAPRFEDAFVDLLRGGVPNGASPLAGARRPAEGDGPPVEAQGLSSAVAAGAETRTSNGTRLLAALKKSRPLVGDAIDVAR